MIEAKSLLYRYFPSYLVLTIPNSVLVALHRSILYLSPAIHSIEGFSARMTCIHVKSYKAIGHQRFPWHSSQTIQDLCNHPFVCCSITFVINFSGNISPSLYRPRLLGIAHWSFLRVIASSGH